MPKKKLLLIDDEAALCRFVKLNLERTGAYEVTTALSGEAGLEAARKTEFDLVITDFKMPGMDGQAVLDALKAMKPHAPVVLFSVYHDDPMTISDETKRMTDGIISKPINNEQLHRVIRQALAKGGTQD